MRMKEKTYDWGAVIFDVCIMIMAVVVSIWQDNPNFLWLLLLMICSGKYWKGGK